MSYTIIFSNLKNLWELLSSPETFLVHRLIPPACPWFCPGYSSCSV